MKQVCRYIFNIFLDKSSGGCHLLMVQKCAARRKDIYIYIKTGPKIFDTLSLIWCIRDFLSLLFSGRRAKKDTKNRMKKVGMCAPGTETIEEPSETIGGLQDYTYII